MQSVKVNPAAILIGLLSCWLPLTLTAASSDKSQPIHIEADQLEIRDNDNISIYSGNVDFAQGSLRIQSDQLIIRFTADKDLLLLEMTGSPATFRQLDDDNQPMHGRAKKLDYHTDESLLVLRGNAWFQHNDDSIEGDMIRINTENDHIEANSAASDERIRMVIQPKSRAKLKGTE